MSDTQRASAALRFTIVGAVSSPIEDSLEGLGTAELPQGALAFVTVTRASYHLDKPSTVTPTSDGAIVAAKNGGNWVLFDGPLDPRVTQAVGTASLAGSAAFAVVQNTWTALPSGSGFYAPEPAASGVFSLNATTGVITYLGAAGRYRVSITVTVASANAADNVELAVSPSPTIIGTTTFQDTAGSIFVAATTGEQITTSRVLTLANGDTLQAAVRNLTGAHNLTVSHLNITFQPA